MTAARSTWLGRPSAGVALLAGLVACGCAGGDDAINKEFTKIVRLVAPPGPRHYLDVLQRDPNPDMRREAYLKLADPKLYVNDPVLRKRMINVFGLALESETDSALVRAAVARALGRFSGPEAQEALGKGAKDASPVVRADVMTSMGQVRQQAGVAPLTQAVLADPDVDVRVAAAAALRRFPVHKAISALAAALSDDNVAVARRVFLSLKEVTGEDLGFDQKAWRAYLDKNRALYPEDLVAALQRRRPKPRRRILGLF